MQQFSHTYIPSVYHHSTQCLLYLLLLGTVGISSDRRCYLQFTVCLFM